MQRMAASACCHHAQHGVTACGTVCTHAAPGNHAHRNPSQVLTASTTSGQLISYLAALPPVHAAHGARVAHLTSLSELAVVDLGGCAPAARLAVDVEPAFCAVGPEHVAVGINNQVCLSGGVLFKGDSCPRSPQCCIRTPALGCLKPARQLHEQKCVGMQATC